MELFTVRSELMPWFLALQTLLLEGEFPVMDLVGIVAGHAYHVLHTSGKLEAPQRLRDAFAGSAFLVQRYRAVGEEFALEGQ